MSYYKNLKNMNNTHLEKQIENLFTTRILKYLNYSKIDVINKSENIITEISYHICFKNGVSFTFKIDFSKPNDINYYIQDIGNCDFIYFANTISQFNKEFYAEKSSFQVPIINYIESNIPSKI